MIVTGPGGGGGSSASGAWYYSRSEKTGTSVQRHTPRRVEQTQVETSTAPKTGMVFQPYAPGLNALLSLEV